jgi:hypothetical protein
LKEKKNLSSVDLGVLRRRVFRTLAILLVRIASLTFLLDFLLTLEIETARQTTQRHMRPQLKKSQFSSHLIGKIKGKFTLAMKTQRGSRGTALLILQHQHQC